MPRRALFATLLSVLIVLMSTQLLRPAAPTTAQVPTLITVKAGEWFFEPASITVTASAEVSLTLEHVGDAMIPHDIVFELDGGRTEASERIRGGGADKLGFVAPAQAGEYVFFCSVGNHRGLGMEGTLVVAGSGTVEPSPAATEAGTMTPPATATATDGPIWERTFLPRLELLRSVATATDDAVVRATGTVTATRMAPPEGCERPRALCPPRGDATFTPVPGQGTPTVCPFCRPR